MPSLFRIAILKLGVSEEQTYVRPMNSPDLFFSITSLRNFSHTNKNEGPFLSVSVTNLNLRKKLIKCYIWSMALYGAETWTLRAADQKYLESFEMWCWRRMEKISWTDHVRNEEVLLRVNEQRNIIHEIRKRKANWIGHILRRNCLLKQVIEGKIKGEMEVARRRGRRRKKLLDDLKDRRGYSHL